MFNQGLIYWIFNQMFVDAALNDIRHIWGLIIVTLIYLGNSDWKHSVLYINGTY